MEIIQAHAETIKSSKEKVVGFLKELNRKHQIYSLAKSVKRLGDIDFGKGSYPREIALPLTKGYHVIFSEYEPFTRGVRITEVMDIDTDRTLSITGIWDETTDNLSQILATETYNSHWAETVRNLEIQGDMNQTGDLTVPTALEGITRAFQLGKSRVRA